MAMSQWMKQSSKTDVTKRTCGLWTLDGKFMNWKVEKNLEMFHVSSVAQTVETDSNILDEYAAKNEWNFSKGSKTNRPSLQR
jgi:hypothetical protein